MASKILTEIDRHEVITEDPDTGAQKARKLARFDLVPPGPLWLLAEHYGKGSQKYTRTRTVSYQECIEELGKRCTCQNNTDQPNVTPTDDMLQKGFVSRATKNDILEHNELPVIPTVLRMSEDSVESVTIENSKNIIHSTLSDSETIISNGVTRMSSASQVGMSDTDNCLEPNSDVSSEITSEPSQNLGLPGMTKQPSWPYREADALSAESLRLAKETKDSQGIGSTSTMTTIPSECEASSAEDAIKGLDCWATIQARSKGHLLTCRTRHLTFTPTSDPTQFQLTETGDRNWEGGYDWEKSYDSMLHHAILFQMGEDYDEETQSLHIIAVAWHAFALAEFFYTHPEKDNRPYGSNPHRDSQEA